MSEHLSPDQRAAFEGWFAANSENYTTRKISKDARGRYFTKATALAWASWCAANSITISEPIEKGLVVFADKRFGCHECGMYMDDTTGFVSHLKGCHRS